MKKRFLLKTMLLLCALIAGSSSVWAGDVVGTINFNNTASGTAISSSSVTGDDSQGNTWTITTVGTSSFTANSAYYQVGSSSKPASSITFTTTLPSNQNIKAFSAKFGGFSNTAGDITLEVGSTAVATGSLSASNDVIVGGDIDPTSGTVLTVTVNKIAKGVKCYYISYTYEDDTPSSNVTFTTKNPSINFPAAKTYSQTPTTAAGYSGTITYSITENTAGATINATSGVVTVTGGGSVTVKATAAATDGFAGSEDTYTLTVNDTRTSAGLSWSAASADVTYGADNNVFPTLTNTHSVPVTYSSTNTKAATINASTGEITLLDVTATTSIKAVFTGNDDYLPQTVSYTLNVTKAPFAKKDGVFDFVEAAAADEDYGSGISTTNDGNHYETTDATWTAGNVTMVTSGKYRWWYNGYNLRFYNNDPQSKFTLSVPNGYVITKVVIEGGNSFSANVGDLTSGTWTGASQSVVFTYNASNSQNVNKITVTYGTTVPVSIGATGWATYSAGVALDFENADDGIEAYMITGVSGTTLTTSKVTGIIPAETGLLVKGAEGTYNVPVVASSSTSTGDNKLIACLKATTVKAGEDSNVNYVLVDNDGTAEFQWIDETDATVGAGKAYLTLADGPKPDAGAPGLTIDIDGNSTAIDEVRSAKEEVRSDFFDLQGRKVANPTKGLYIVNGKKVIVK